MIKQEFLSELINMNERMLFIGNKHTRARRKHINKTAGLMARISRVEFRESAGRDSLKHLLGEDSQELPTDIQ